jgi:Histidinol-phosphate/aromatic aminotransferase and cobyric acid decarboxylase
MKDLSDLPKTVHGGTAWKLKGVEDFSHNLNPFGFPDDLSDIISAAVPGIDHYPDDSCAELKDIIAKAHGVDAENVLVAAGSSELIRSFPFAFLGNGCKALIPNPSFAEYSQQCRISGTEVIFNKLLPEDDFRLDLEKTLGSAKDVDAIYICNPNNPTGRIEPKDKIMTIVEECARHGTMVFLDETLLELVPDYRKMSCVEFVKDFDNLMIIGSLTKSFAIPGIRIGFGFGSKKVTEHMEKVRSPWNIGHIEQVVASHLIKNRMDHVKKAADTMKSESKWMYSQLKECGFPVTPTDSFFFFNSLEKLGMKCSEFKEQMLNDNIMIRDCASFGTPYEWYVRFCVKDRERNIKFVDSVKRIMER